MHRRAVLAAQDEVSQEELEELEGLNEVLDTIFYLTEENQKLRKLVEGIGTDYGGVYAADVSNKNWFDMAAETLRGTTDLVLQAGEMFLDIGGSIVEGASEGIGSMFD